MKKLIGNKAFYKTLLCVAIPIMIQNGITNFVGMLDNIMVGQVGTNQMSGVAIINQMMVVFNVTIFGAVSGAGIFSAQYFGCKDYEGVRNSFRYKMMVGFGVLVVSIFLFGFKGQSLIQLYLHDVGNSEAVAATLQYAWEYLLIMLIGLVPFTIEQVYSSTLRETSETVLPMKAGIVAVFVNLVLNYILIFGKLGCPALGVNGAAIATVISRYVQMVIVVAWTHKHLVGEKTRPELFMTDVYKNFKVPGYLFGRITAKALPLLLNEFLWALGMATLMQCYSVRGLDVVAGMNISNTIMNVFNVVYIALGSAISIILGQLLGAGKLEQAKEDSVRLIFFSVTSCITIAIIMMVLSSVFPEIYNTTETVKLLGKYFICVAALTMPMAACVNATYFVLRSGGKTGITFLFDSVFVWVLMIPVAYILSRYTHIHAVWLYFACQSLELIKCVIGVTLVKKGVWIQNIT